MSFIKLSDTLLISMIIIDLYLCYKIFENNKQHSTISSFVDNLDTEILLIGLLFMNFLSFIYELNLKYESFLNIFFITLINISVLGSVLFKYYLAPEEHLFFAVVLFISIGLYMIFSSYSKNNYKLVYIQLILSGLCIYNFVSKNDNDNYIFIIEIFLLLNFALFYLSRHIYLRSLIFFPKP